MKPDKPAVEPPLQIDFFPTARPPRPAYLISIASSLIRIPGSKPCRTMRTASTASSRSRRACCAARWICSGWASSAWRQAGNTPATGWRALSKKPQKCLAAGRTAPGPALPFWRKIPHPERWQHPGVWRRAAASPPRLCPSSHPCGIGVFPAHAVYRQIVWRRRQREFSRC